MYNAQEQANRDWTISAMILCSLYVDRRPQTPDDVIDFIIIHLYGDLIELGYDPDNNQGWKKTVRSLMAIKTFIERVPNAHNKLCQYRLIEKKVGEVGRTLFNQTKNTKLHKLVVEQNIENVGSLLASNNAPAIATPKKRGRKPKRAFIEQSPPQKQVEPEPQSPSEEPRAKRMKLQEENAATPVRSRVNSTVVTPSVSENLRQTRARALAPEGPQMNSPFLKEARSRKASESPSTNKTPKGKITSAAPAISDSKLVVKRGRGRPRKIQPDMVQ